MQGFHINERQNREDIRDLCCDLNKLVREWYSTSDESKAVQTWQEIEGRYQLLADAYSDAAADGKVFPYETEQPEDGKRQDSSTVSDRDQNGDEMMAALLRSDKRSTKYYTVISKEEARKEIAGLAEYYPDHSFYAVTDIMDENGEECFTMVMDEGQEEPLGYYPELDRAKTEVDRKKVMEGFFSGSEEYYIYSKPEDFFAR